MKKKENMELNQHLKAIKPSKLGRYLLIDTCFLLDATNTRQKERVSKCGQIIEYFKKQEFSLHTINPVYIEFIKGSDTTGDFKKKKEIFDDIVPNILTVTPEILENAEKICRAYRRHGREVEYTDYLLAGTLMKYSKNLSLLTKNFKHFPRNTFEIVHFLPIEGEVEIQNYVICRFSEDKYQETLKKLSKTNR